MKESLQQQVKELSAQVRSLSATDSSAVNSYEKGVLDGPRIRSLKSSDGENENGKKSLGKKRLNPGIVLEVDQDPGCVLGWKQTLLIALVCFLLGIVAAPFFNQLQWALIH